LERVDYDDRQHLVYRQGRAVSDETAGAWMQTFARHVPPQRPLSVLDLGSGTGRFAPVLAEAFGGPVYGVEPSAKMRQDAERSSAHPSVTYLAGNAERIPLSTGSCDVVVLFLVFHHVQDRQAAAAEIARVLRPHGSVLIRSTFADRMPELGWHRFFPRAFEIEKQMFPTVAEVVDVFAGVGLDRRALEAVPERFANSLAESAARLHLRAISTFEFLTAEETEQGFAALDAAVAAETTPRPVEGISDLLVLG
jgi:ubiquinone/menaquinone biosynthesis C-methylase UbiE